VVLADDHPVVRSGIRGLLEDAPEIEVVGEAADGAEALKFVAELTPDVLILDMEMPVLSGVEVARKLAGGDVRVLALSAYNDEQYIFATLASGVAGYLTKDEAPEHIVEAVRGVARGDRGWLSRSIADKVVSHAQPQLSAYSELLDPLTNREQEVLCLMSQSYDNSEIAHVLLIAERTVKNHVSNIYSKLGVKGRTKAIAWAVERGIGRAGSVR